MSNPINNGGAAFPRITERAPDGGVNEWGESGMTLRDWFAGMALQGIASITIESAVKNRANPDNVKTALAEACYGIADAMLAARNGKEEA